MKKLLSGLCIFCFLVGAAQTFKSDFKSESLRFDFVFSGNVHQTTVDLAGIYKIKQWSGRKVNLRKNALQGDAEINVYDKKTNALIYTQSFSTLYQEWLTQKQAQTDVFTAEQVLYIPVPKNDFVVQVNFFENNIPFSAFKQTFTKKQIKHLKPLKPTYAVDVKPLNKAINSESVINLTIVAEGFKEDEKEVFFTAANRAVQAIFSYPSFKKYKDNFSIQAVFIASQDAGVTIPSKKIFKNTIAQTTFDTFNSERYLTTNKVFKMHDALVNTPTNHLLIIANSNQYGGAGIYNAYTLVTLYDKTFDEVTVHEFGHSFVGLGDEYFYANDIFSDNAHKNNIEPWVKNNTTLVDFDSKWKHKLDKNTPIPTPYTEENKNTIGVYLGIEGGKVYIPYQDCRMHTNTATDFCSVCSDAIEELILHYTQQQ